MARFLFLFINVPGKCMDIGQNSRVTLKPSAKPEVLSISEAADERYSV